MNSWSSMMLNILLVAAMSTHVCTYKVLLFPIPTRSHVSAMAAIAEGLVNRGHNEVTLFIGQHFPLNVPELSNRAEFSVVRYKDAMEGEHIDYNAEEENYTKSIIENGGNFKQQLAAAYDNFQKASQLLTVHNDDALDKLEREKFDVAVVDGSDIPNVMYLVPHRLQIPYITMPVAAVDPFAIKFPWLPSFVPNVALPLSEQMTFIERLKNTAAVFFLPFIKSLYLPDDPEQEVLDKFRRYGYFNSLDELRSKSAMWFLLRDNVLDYPRPMMPNMVDVGGLTIKRSTGKLPPDIINFIDGAKKGVILMTFGSMSSVMPVHILEKFSSVFRRLDSYRVIWRLENKDDVELPVNVMISQWLPQNDILAHQSVKLFIAHGGANGQLEAVYHGVPMIGFPLMYEQYHNAKRIEYKGYGLSMDLHDFTADQLLENIRKILGDKSYKERVMKASEIFRSQAQSPVERAIFWIEHVCQFGGDHLRSAGNDLPLYSYLMLDVLAFVLILLHIFIFLFFRLATFILRKCCGQTKPTSEVTKKLN